MEDSGYPTYDPDKASEEMDTCLAELGTDIIEFTFNTTNDPFNVETNSLIISMWEDALGDRVEATITPIEQGQYIGLALNGTFNAFGWSNHAGVDPDTQNYWWRSTSATPVGSVALNFGRFKDPDIDAALDIIHSDPDPDTRREAAEEINRIFGEQVYNLWLSWTLWGIVSQPYVNGVESNALPDGGDGVGLAYWGKHNTNQLWCDDGVCESDGLRAGRPARRHPARRRPRRGRPTGPARRWRTRRRRCRRAGRRARRSAPGRWPSCSRPARRRRSRPT